jgi:NAD(P)-dependent dehydrogenase (short-subunit alcohol dehydrogenase family)
MADIVMITGGSGGIGAATAARLTTAGTRVVLVAREPERLAAQAAALGVPWLASDVLDPAGLGAAVERIEAEHGAIAGLVHAVGSIVLRPLHTLSLEDWHRTLDLNVTSAFNALKAVLPKMMRRRRGRVVLFSSVAAQTGLPNHEAISAAKGAVEALVRSAAVGYARYGIRVNAIAPALIRTELSRTLWESEAAANASLALHPLGRLGEPDDVAAAAAYLMSDDAGWVTGQILGVDGGLASGAAPRR